ncbi:carboxypeptidase-like regulatory domain-containing protein [uncultured Winogradskyella sp.]|uniref:carboxypeptidase-like regulatory domain-containing protein n=1 Tax=uncultured Winogradskyella sp. TaxID=395353 RepID=UPI002635C58E|nr:carboxypeptidase-like regulatory domain-containing protein [uncultured Winogradskyella sp.]
MKVKYVFTFLCLISVCAISIAQNSNEILCKVLDVESKYPVSYATIQFKGEQKGVIADEDGGFRLPIEYVTSNVFVTISSIGFETLTVDIRTLDVSVLNTIYLKPKTEALNEVLIIAQTKKNTKNSKALTHITPESIIKEAIKKIPVNYPKAPHSYMAYYRDYQLVNNNYYNLNEFILETFDAGFQTSKFWFKNNVTAMYSYNRNKNYYQDSLLQKSVYGDSKIINKDNSAIFINTLSNELEILNVHNPIRNYNKLSFSFVDKFKDDFINNHVFKFEKIKYINDTPLYEISFLSENSDDKKFKAKGEIYIAKDDYSIYKITYKILENEQFEQNKSLGNNGTNFQSEERLRTLYEINVEYKQVNNKMYLNYMTFNNRFIIKEPNPFRVVELEFNVKDEVFYITFNKPVDESSLSKKSRFKLKYKTKKLTVKKIELVDDKIVKVEVVDWTLGENVNKKKIKSEDFSCELKNIKDVSGVKLNKDTKLKGFQFREFFTQEIFENKEPVPNLIYVNKNLPLSATYTNPPNFDINTYWVNSPLKKTKDPIKI